RSWLRASPTSCCSASSEPWRTALRSTKPPHSGQRPPFVGRPASFPQSRQPHERSCHSSGALGAPSVSAAPCPISIVAPVVRASPRCLIESVLDRYSVWPLPPGFRTYQTRSCVCGSLAFALEQLLDADQVVQSARADARAAARLVFPVPLRAQHLGPER